MEEQKPVSEAWEPADEAPQPHSSATSEASLIVISKWNFCVKMGRIMGTPTASGGWGNVLSVLELE